MAYFITKDKKKKKLLTKVTLVFIIFNRCKLSYLIPAVLHELLFQNFLDTCKMNIRGHINSKTNITSIVFVHIIIINTSIQHMLL